ncbi:AAA family ATPase [Pseudomonas fluorescens]|uniref:AAA family ATPase n=1 Tax=Pseudomonas TaxID=286 RepID=UPI0014046904|nr:MULTISPECIES: AAA family ATPase [Pseudomonas]MDT8908101.1 AAA family ATPase [Pseudomonas prosekii]NHN70820.1 AAA family ATPase [Pseudomonas fluorescens]
MINQIDIANFGSFSGLEWKKSVRDSGKNVKTFQRLNILYGRNYSGKTTLSRVFRALETHRLPLNYAGSSFTVTGDKGAVTCSGLLTHNYDVRVYNRDFVTDNLSFLVNQDGGEIKTFAIVGEQNKEIDDAIASIEARLGSVEAKAGLRFDLEAKRKERDRTKTDHSTAFTALEGKLRSHAADKIKKNLQYGVPVYNIDHIRRDIAATKKAEFVPLTLQEQAGKISLLKQEALPDITDTLAITLQLDSLKGQAEPILSKVITPTKPIQELLNDGVLQLWVKQGIAHHRDKREACAFCRQSLPHDIWQRLDEHFSKESGDLETDLDNTITSVNDELAAVAKFNSLKGEQFYTEERSNFDASSKALAEELDIYKKDMEALKKLLETRKNNLFQAITLLPPLCDPKEIQKHVDAINTLIAKNNGKTKTLEKDKTAAREALRLADVSAFADAITYETESAHIATLKISADTASAAYTDVEKEIRDAEAEVQVLRAKQKDERKGAERVNSLLNNFFGHDGLKLEPRDSADKATVKFEITRDGKAAYNLSEGECSLIAFCYFIAKLEDPESKGKELIIYIDDPISSLDSNHIFFMFSLIESLIAKPIKKIDESNGYRYKQLFISTHNLDFLKYLKRLSIPTKKISAGADKTKTVYDHEHFMIERNGAASNILLMPSYLKDYITEFHYLFHQIYKCKNQDAAQISHEPFFGFGNNLRKFLEAFLFFKYPYHDDRSDTFERIKKFFGEEEDTAVALVNRLNNEFSHLEAVPDRSFKPVEIPEIAKVANYVLDKIYASDAVQYNALLKSIGEPERVV